MLLFFSFQFSPDLDHHKVFWKKKEDSVLPDQNGYLSTNYSTSAVDLKEKQADVAVKWI